MRILCETILAAALAAVCPAAQTYQVRDRAEITSLNGDCDFELAGRRGKIRVPELTDWTFSKDPRLKYFSGTAVYHATFDMDGVSSGKQVLSLGESNGQIARVFINGIDIGASWCEPYELEIPAGTLVEKNNTIDIEWTNTWANRLIGDEQEPPDCEMVEAPYPGGWYLKRFPDWFATGIRSRRSNGRKCFTDWNYFTKDSPLTPSGLLGPVAIRSF